MTKITLLGDSIRMGYGKRVEELLGDSYQTVQFDDNGRFVKYTLRGVLHEWQPEIRGSEIVHWNNGLWDVCDLHEGVPFTSLDEYLDNLGRVADALHRLGAKVIFATSTPVRPEMWGHSIERIRQYNSAAAELLTGKGVYINDLFTPVYRDLDRCISKEDLIHLTPHGVELCAGLVAGAIRKVHDENA